MYKMVYFIWPRKLDQRCVNQHQAFNLALDLKNQINISCYTESQALRLSLIYNTINGIFIVVIVEQNSGLSNTLFIIQVITKFINSDSTQLEKETTTLLSFC